MFFEKVVETSCRLLDFCLVGFLRHFGKQITKDLSMTNMVPHFLKKGERREEEEKKKG